jgi:hypothetical protein
MIPPKGAVASVNNVALMQQKCNSNVMAENRSYRLTQSIHFHDSDKTEHDRRTLSERGCEAPFQAVIPTEGAKRPSGGIYGQGRAGGKSEIRNSLGRAGIQNSKLKTQN